MLTLRFLARVKALERAISSPVGRWCEVAEVKLLLSGSRDCDEGPLDDGISCHKGWGFLRAAINESVCGVCV